MADGQVVFEITGDRRPINQALRETTGDIERESRNWDRAAGQAGDNIQGKFGKVFKAVATSAVAAKVGKVLLDFGKDAIQAASDLQEVQNVVDVTFGDGARQIETWAQKAGTQFGLTETQAKKFTSTLGAMMKSAGLAGPEIVGMSTDLAGLAADMASFYNLDFETAFQKIRSGISGETEPLKQLGINMSVANLEAFALTQGITKAFDQMSQGEQTMLRYQYLMQATADAQGDFARTSDGFANGLRALETNIDQLKTNVGTLLLPVINDVISGVNDMVSALTVKPTRTVLDDFADVDKQTAARLAEIQETADGVKDLVAVLEELGGKKIAADGLTKFVDDLTGKINGLGGAMSKAKDGDYAGTISEIAGAMAAATGGDASAWNTLLTAIGSKLPDAVDATLDDKGQTAAFLAAAGAAADSLGGEYPALWAEMLGVLGDDAGAAITALAKGATAAAALNGLANGANTLSPTVDVDKWKSLLTVLSGTGNIDLSGTGQSITDLAEALNSSEPGSKAQAWETFLNALYADVDNLSKLTGKDAEGTIEWLDGIKLAAQGLAPDDAAGWATLFGEIRKGLPKLTAKEDWLDVLGALKSTGSIDLGNTGKSISQLAEALNGEDPGTDRAQAWRELLDALSADVEGLSKLTGTSAEDTAAWLATLAEGANALDPNSAEGWDKLFAQLVTGLPGLGDTNAAGLFAELAGGADDAETYLRALGYSTDDIADAQAAWLEVCRRLVQTLPGLNEIINTETGEVKGGVAAIDEYVNAWKEGQEKIALWKAYYQKEELLNKRRENEYLARVDSMGAEQRVKRLRAQLDKYGGYDAVNSNIGINGNGDWYLKSGGYSKQEQEEILGLYAEYGQAVTEAAQAAEIYENEVNANAQAVQDLADEKQALIETVGEEENATNGAADAMGDAADAMAEWSKETKDAATEAVTAAADALEALDKYYQDVHADTKRSIDGVVSGFEKIITPAEQARQKMSDLTKEIDELNAAGKDSTGLQKTYADMENSIPSVQNMTEALQDQLDYLTQYQEYLAQARAAGVSDAVLASLSDGSTQSFDYLKALATTGSAKEIEELNSAYAQVEAAKASLTDSLTEQRLAADSEFTALSDAATAAVASLDQYATAEGNMEHTVQGIADGIAAKVPAVQAQVDALLSALSSLDSAGIFGKGLLGRSVKGSKFSLNLDGTHAVGLDYVPFDNYLAALHEGESVLTAEESRVWRNFKYGATSGVNALDYDALGGVMRENVKAGGNVYLDGRTVGRVISERQADSLRNLERSGWQG